MQRPVALLPRLLPSFVLSSRASLGATRSLGIYTTSIPSFSLNGARSFATRREAPSVVVRDFGVIANYVPPEPANRPALSDLRKWSLVKWRNLRNSVQNLMGVGLVKYRSEYEKWNTAKFLQLAQETYKDMNDAFARGDRRILEEVCLDSMYSTLKNQIKSRQPQQTLEWGYHGDVEAPRIVCVRCMGSGGLRRTGLAIAQITSMAVYDKKGRLVAGDPEKAIPVLEYLVFQRILSDPNDTWRIYGKVSETVQKF